MMRSSLDHFDAAVESGGCVITGERSAIVSLVQETIQSGKSATFYVTKPQFDAIMSWYWTPERRKRRNVEPVSLEEQQKIESELEIKGAQFLYSNRITCGNCGRVNGAFEFVQQGIREHGREIVETALTLANACVVRVNPSTVTVCQYCRETWPIAHEYECGQYGCCFIETLD